MRTALLAAAAFLAISTTAAAEDLALACHGSGTYQAASGQSAVFRDSATGDTTTAYGSTSGQGVVPEAAVRFEMSGDSARILMPHVMTPGLNRGSDAGWWAVERLAVTPTEITGRFTLNFLNKPTIRIDRMRGAIEVDGSFYYYFQGECERIEAPTAPRF